MNVRELCRLLSATLHLPGVDRWAAQEYEAERLSIFTLSTRPGQRTRCVQRDLASGGPQAPETGVGTGGALEGAAPTVDMR